jgi:glycosyltransferase involved in cell wall biosynthesis
MGRPYFSCLIVNYNYGRFLKQAVESLLSQDFPQKEREILVVDDGSTDDSVAVAESFKDKIVVLRQSNQGQAAGYEAAFAGARGEVFALGDSDDWWEPQRLSAFAEALEPADIGLAQHYLKDVDVNGRPLKNQLPAWPAVYTIEDYIDGRCEDAATSGLAFKRDVLMKTLPVPRTIFSWYDEFLISHALLHSKMANIPRVLGFHRVHAANNWAHRLGDPGKMVGYVEQGRIFFAHFENALAKERRELTPRFRRALTLDFSRSLLLADVYRGDRVAAWRRWRALPPGFRRAMLLLGLVHPKLYMAVYRFYSESPALRKARRALIPS